jgi:YbgC/YbaW family acyl-CoA thioester hydrolase
MVEIDFQVNFSDCDPAGVMYFANYFKLAHQAYEIAAKKFEAYDEIFFNSNLIFPIVKAEAQYKRMIKAGDIIAIKLFAKEIRENFYKLNFEFYSQNTKELKAIVETLHFCVDKKELKRKQLPETIEHFIKSLR